MDVQQALTDAASWVAMPDPNEAAHVLAAEVERLRKQWDELVYQRSEQADEVARLRAQLDQGSSAARRAAEAAARIDTAFSHGLRSGSEDPVTTRDWHELLAYARAGA